nr:MAG TPA: hypothetical protein [Caudoviricetes sp.]DAY32249.1 MAG TPA: hypothetical protein [Caudoviricetes sp.]
MLNIFILKVINYQYFKSKYFKLLSFKIYLTQFLI